VIGLAGHGELSAVLEIPAGMPDSALVHSIGPATILSPNANGFPVVNAVSPAHTKDAGSPTLSVRPWPQPMFSLHDAGLGGGAQSRSWISQRTEFGSM